MRHRKTRDRVHHQRHIQTLVAEVLGDRRCHVRALEAHQRRLVRGGYDHDRARQTELAQVALDELLQLTAALADQGDHGHVGARAARDGAEQRALADAAAREDAHALALADGQQAIDRAHARDQRRRDRLA